MAESFLFSIAENIMGKLTSLALKEVCLPWGLESDLKKVEKNLTTIKMVLLDAEEKQAQDHELQLWLGRLKLLCYDAEDVLDEFEYEGLRKKVVKQYGTTKTKVRRFFSSSNPLAFRLKMAHKIKELRERLDEIAQQKSKFSLTKLGDHQIATHRERTITDSLLCTSNVVGRDFDKNQIMEFLLDPNLGGGTFPVIPIVGIGGMGKTTLAKMLYNDVRIGKCFDRKIWVCVSQEFDKRKIMIDMIKSLTDQDRANLNPDQLQKLIVENLDSKKFLLVLDDVWSDDRGKWVEFMDLLVGGASGSKVVVTTRSASVATIVGTFSTHNLEDLSYEDSLSLFKKLAFKEGEEERYPHLMKIGDDIVKKCKGVPLAVKTLATLLYSKTDERYWRFICDNEIWKLKQKENDILPVLRLSYGQMPSHLKPCFVICSSFPKDYIFDNIWLANVWMAHGLIQPSYEKQELEDVALQYMEELYSRSFFQEFKGYGSFFLFKMHDLVHDLALSVAQNECFGLNVTNKEISEGIRHLLISDMAVVDQEVPNYLQKVNSLRTLFFHFEPSGSAAESFVSTCISNCKYLRVLHLRSSSFEFLPDFIGSLKHLRYLDLSTNYRLKRLPDSICKLHSLLVLSVAACLELEELPTNIRNLVKLRNLTITVRQKCLPKDGIGCLSSLRVLNILDCNNLEYLLEEAKNLTSLRVLTIWSCRSLVSLLSNLKYLTALEILIIKDCKQVNLMEEDGIHDIELTLRSLLLGQLPQLVTLPQWLQKCSKTLDCLSIESCENLSSLPDWLEDFSSLRKIEIDSCPKLLSLPDWRHHLIALKELRIRECPALHKRCKKGGEDWNKIANVTKIDLGEDESDLDEDESDGEDESDLDGAESVILSADASDLDEDESDFNGAESVILSAD